MSRGLALFAIVFSIVVHARANDAVPFESPTSFVRWRALFGQLFAWNIQAEYGMHAPSVLEQSLYFSRKGSSFSDFQAIINAKDSVSAFQAREKLLSVTSANSPFKSRMKAIDTSVFLSDGWSRNSHEWRSTLGLIDLLKRSDIGTGPDFLTSEAGEQVREILRDYVIVVVPGFGSHTMTEYGFSDLVEMANHLHGRAPIRAHRTNAQGVVEFEDPATYYSKYRDDLGFDVVHPLGNELGNSTAADSESAAFLAQWIRNLPATHAKKSLILFGYSKGAAIAHAMVAEHPDIRARTRRILTVAGVVQGALPAQSALREGRRLALNQDGRTFGNQAELLEYLEQQQGPQLASTVLAFVGSATQRLRLLAQSTGVGEWLKDFLGVDVEKEISTLERQFSVNEAHKVLTGVGDMSLTSRLTWNLKNLNNRVLDQPLTVFNLSVLTNIQDFLLSPSFDQYGPLLPPQIVPQFEGRTGINWQRFSLDNVFLHGSSLVGFAEAPGGLFDTQVAWRDSKSLPLDDRPLGMDLNQEERQELCNAMNWATTDCSQRMSVPRRRLINEESLEGLSFIDLGETRGSHWDIAFSQVFRLPQSRFEHAFPRAAYARAILETFAVYELLSQGEAP